MITDQEIINYLMPYWEKYPQEKETDPCLDYILDMKYVFRSHLSESSLIFYEEHNDFIEIIMYWCDGGDQDQRFIRRGLVDHKRFVKSFNKPVYICGIKDLFKRDNMVKYNSEINMWEFV